MGSYNQLRAVDPIEVLDNLASENPSGSSRIPFPSLNIFWITPH